VKYLKAAREKGRDETCIKTSCNAHLRSAACMFSKQMLEVYNSAGLNFVNPFIGRKFRRIEIRPYTPLPKEVLDAIWRDAPKLRDADPNAPLKRRSANSQQNEQAAGAGGQCTRFPRRRWHQPNWRKPHPEAYVLLLLELGLGLRREEADKLQWDWFYTGSDGRRFIEVRKTEFFIPKGKRRRIISVEPVLSEAIHGIRSDLTAFVVSGNMPKKYTPQNGLKNVVYRCERHHRILTAWLRKLGIKDSKPCHLLRKEFALLRSNFIWLVCGATLLGTLVTRCDRSVLCGAHQSARTAACPNFLILVYFAH
jgi:hypothetical protein